ncbi:outer membrane protein assembly factor BamB family protein [Bythopirellula goksoeyrii]|nr:PQQ-binding-like beta-propeller repeat protein [Bythopirellula goksoeyrii]
MSRLTLLIAVALVSMQSSLIVEQGAAQQQIITQQENIGSDAFDLYSDRKLSRGIERARERISEGEFSQAIRFLDEVLADPQDSFADVADSEDYQGLKNTASKMIRDLPPDGIELYESMFGPLARKKLGEAVGSGNFADVRAVSQRYFYTSAGFEAAILLAQHEADRGEHLAANLIYQRLLDTPRAALILEPQLSLLAAKSLLVLGRKDRAEDLLERIPGFKGNRSPSVVVAGRQQSLSGRPLDWFDKEIGIPNPLGTPLEREWLLAGGNTARNGRSEGGLPHTRVRWQARLLNRPQFEDIYDDIVDSLEQRQKPLSTAGTPLAIANTIVAATAHNVVAFDFLTGKRVWQTQPQRVAEFEQLLALNEEASQNDTNLELAQAFARRIWNDYLYNSISSDGKRVFVIRDISLTQFAEQDIWALPFRGGGFSAETPESSNRLCAYELATQGKLVWEIDGAARTDELAGAFFLGAPIAVNNHLYCMAEIKSSIHLVAIDQNTGQLLWLQQLADLHSGITLDPQRRLQGAIPSYDSGILVCPTSAGVVVGYNLEMNSIAWHFQYENNRSTLEYLRRSRGRAREAPGEWIDGSVILADGCALLSPPEADGLYCLDLLTGKLLWERKRGDGIFVAGVDQGLVLIVGTHNVTAVSLEDGQPVWEKEKLALPSATSPTGRGFFSAEKYFLPLSNSQVVAIDLKKGVIADRVIARSGATLGNLISHRGAILSQNGRFLECFDQIDVLRRMTEARLAKNPADSEALRTLGEITFNEGNLAKAIEYLEKADSLSPGNLRTHEVLSECLLEALAKDFTSYQDRIPKLRELLASSPDQTLKLQRIESAGLVEIDKLWDAFLVCLEIFHADHTGSELQQIDSEYDTSIASWTKAQTAIIWRLADQETQEKIADSLAQTRRDLSSEQGVAGLKSFVANFGGIDELVENTTLEISRNLLNEQQLLAAQQGLLDFASLNQNRINDNSSEREAIASLSKILHQTDLKRLARPYDDELAGQLADVVCLDGKTGLQCVESWADVNALKDSPWPYGQVQVEMLTQEKTAVNHRVNVRTPLAEVRLEHGDDLLSRCNIFYSSRVAELIIRDSLGNEVSRQMLGEQERQVLHGGVYGVARGNLLILSLGQLIVAVDTLAPRSENGGAVLWRKRISRNPSQQRFYGGYDSPPKPSNPYSSGTPRVQVDGKWIGVIGPVTRDSFVYQDQRGLHCVHPLTGEILWSRTDTPNACNLFGNDQVVIAMEDSSNKAHVYNLLDGRSLGQVDVPLWREQLATHGTDIFAWQRSKGGHHELLSMDVLTGKTNWKKEFPAGSQIDIAKKRYVAIADPSGNYQIVDAYDGALIVDYHGGEQARARKVYLFAGADTFTVAVEQRHKESSEDRRTWVNFPDYKSFDGELMAFDAATGSPMWSRPAQVRQEALMLSQPPDSPVISFARFYRVQGGGGTKPLASILLLEKASGRVLFADEAVQNSGNMCLVSADESSHEVSLEMINRTVKLRFTDLPRPPEPPATVEANNRDKSGTQGLNRILERFRKAVDPF